MRLKDVVQYEHKLDSLFRATAEVTDLELQAHWAKYLCVLSSGYIEKSVRAIYGEYAKLRTPPQIGRFVSRRLGEFQNAKMSKIVDLTKLFDETWALQLELTFAGEVTDSINSLVANRHSIAHGQDTSVSIARVKTWHEKSRELIAHLEGQCGLNV